MIISRPSQVSRHSDAFPSSRLKVIGDAGEDFDEVLRFVHDDLHALRSIDVRHHEQDDDPLACLKRGYDAVGNPVCPFGYCHAFNGHDYERGDSQWVCRLACLHTSQPDHIIKSLPANAGVPATTPSDPTTCPDREPTPDLGVGLTLPDGDIRLARGPSWVPHLELALDAEVMPKVATPTKRGRA